MESNFVRVKLDSGNGIKLTARKQNGISDDPEPWNPFATIESVTIEIAIPELPPKFLEYVQNSMPAHWREAVGTLERCKAKEIIRDKLFSPQD